MDQIGNAAGETERVAAEVRRLAERALAESAVDWRSVAAAAFRRRLAAEADRVRACAAALDEAAAALRVHARAARR